MLNTGGVEGRMEKIKLLNCGSLHLLKRLLSLHPHGTQQSRAFARSVHCTNTKTLCPELSSALVLAYMKLAEAENILKSDFHL